MTSSHLHFAQQHAAVARIYCWYRVLLATVLLALLIVGPEQKLLGNALPGLNAALGGGYLLVTIAQLFISQTPGRQQLFVVLFIDIGVLLGLTLASGGLTTAMSPLLLVIMAAAGLLLSGQLAMLCAALATLGLLAVTIYQMNVLAVPSQALLPAGILGMLFFGTAVGFQLLAQRLRSTQELAQARAADVSKLQNLNQLIVQRMRTGILVVDETARVKMMNRAAGELLRTQGWQPLLDAGRQPDLGGPLRESLLAWRRGDLPTPPPFTLPDTGRELIARFTSLDVAAEQVDGDTLIFIEDSGQIAQRAQQLKLAALGRLTASIAHEIRNPLGAVSHAAQLLLESAELVSGDKRLAEIIQHHSRRMDSIIDSILQLSRRTPPDPQRIELNHWLKSFMVDYRQGCSTPSAIAVETGEPVLVTVDPQQLGQVITNLLDNALRHSEKATGERRALLSIGRGADGFPKLDVIDDGPGIAEQDREKVFEPFFTTESKGSGLGLHIARELCEINQARLNYTRASGKSCFRINFPHPDRRPLVAE